MIRLLGIDYGTKRIGLAIGDTETGIASPLRTVEAAGTTVDHVRAVLTAASDYEVDAFVVGLPLNMDGTEGTQAKITRVFGDALAQTTSRPVYYCDERLSSFTARELLEPAELSRKRVKRAENAVAAQVMLQDYLDAQRPPQSPE
jgi:putative Holliday junction resolvase